MAFKEMRRKDKQLNREETVNILCDGEYGILSTIGSDEYPYGVPLNYVYHDGSIYFHSADVGHKLENIDNNCKVSFCVIVDTEVIPDDFNMKFKSVIVFGKAQEVFDDEKREGLIAILEKYSGDYMEAGVKYMEKMWDKTRVYKIEIEHMTGKAKK